MRVEVKNNYGQEAIYPACEVSRVFANIAGTRTLTRQTIELARQLGYNVEVLAPTL